MSLAYRARINGAIDTNNNVLDNINKIATSSGCYVTWDPSQGKWNVVINDVGTSQFSFTDSNIISPITLGTSDIDQIYNRVTVQFPHQDLRDSIDTTTFRIPDLDRYNGETDNPLNINLELCNDPVQAQLIAARELKQSRVDKVVTFTADYTANGLLAGEIIDITNSAYGWTNKKWRVITIEEQDGANGELVYGITAIEYDADVYSTAGLVREQRTTETEIKPSSINQCILDEDGNVILDRVIDNADGFAQAGFTPTVDAFETGTAILTPNSITPASNPLTGSISPNLLTIGRTITAPYTGRYKTDYFINWASNIGGGGGNIFDRPAMGCLKSVTMKIEVNGVDALDTGQLALSNTSANFQQLLETQSLIGFFEANQGDTIEYFLQYLHNVNPGDNIAPVGFPSFTVPVGALMAVIIGGETTYLG